MSRIPRVHQPRPRPTWLLGVLAMVALSGCATSRMAEEVQRESSDSVEIGYGKVAEDHVMGSVATVHEEEQKARRPRTLAEMLSEIPGVRVRELPGGRLSVQVRGSSSFQASEEPLWVVDGMVIQAEGGAIGIDPNTIESITVLKDAGATAIYGSRGANGVILIKTKRGSR